jgi:hypothetical protein
MKVRGIGRCKGKGTVLRVATADTETPRSSRARDLNKPQLCWQLPVHNYRWTWRQERFESTVNVR